MEMLFIAAQAETKGQVLSGGCPLFHPQDLKQPLMSEALCWPREGLCHTQFTQLKLGGMTNIKKVAPTLRL